MIERTISIRYARALLSLAKDENQIDAFGVQLEEFCKLCEDAPELLEVLGDRNLGLARRSRILDELAVKAGLYPYFVNFLKLLVRKSRVSLLMHIADAYKDMANKAQGRLPLQVISAVELPESQYEDLVRVFSKKTGKEMVLEKKIKPEVLGGVQVKLADQLFDSTIRRQLAGLSQSLKF